MSLINKMLQDLDARGGHPGPAAASPEIKTVLAPERGLPWLRVALLAALAAGLGASGYMAWRLQQDRAVPAQPAAAAAPVMIPVAAPAPVPAAPVSEPVVEQAEPAAPSEAAPAVEAPAPPPPKPKQVVQAEPTPARKNAPQRQQAEPGAPMQAEAPPAPAARPAAPAKAVGGRVETTVQRAENGYRRALASLDEGRVSEAIGHLQAALRAEPRHEASRQTLVSLLIEAKRPEEAMRQLGAALALDPAQPAMAMLMARLQMERGSPGIDTLLRTLPHAAGNGEYHAFLAGSLQREGRHREALDHYQAALRTSPQNGVWWMGLGMSLQAEKRNAEAGEAYARARASGTLAPELQGFVERKLKTLAR